MLLLYNTGNTMRVKHMFCFLSRQVFIVLVFLQSIYSDASTLYKQRCYSRPIVSYRSILGHSDILEQKVLEHSETCSTVPQHGAINSIKSK